AKASAMPDKPIAVPAPETVAAPPIVEAPELGNDDDDDPDLSDALDNVPLADLVSEPLTSGQMCCPFHEDRTPSLRIYDNQYHCFGCGAHGNQLDWLVNAEGMDPDEAIELLKTWDGPLIDRALKYKKAKANRSRALRLWGEASSITNTLASRYLAEVPDITLAVHPTDIDSALRFDPHYRFNCVHRLC